MDNDLSVLIATQLQELKTKQLEGRLGLVKTSCESQAGNISTASKTRLQHQGQEQCEGSSIISTCVVGWGSAPFCTFRHNNRRSLKGGFANKKTKAKHLYKSSCAMMVIPWGGLKPENTSCTNVALCASRWRPPDSAEGTRTVRWPPPFWPRSSLQLLRTESAALARWQRRFTPEAHVISTERDCYK